MERHSNNSTMREQTEDTKTAGARSMISRQIKGKFIIQTNQWQSQKSYHKGRSIIEDRR